MKKATKATLQIAYDMCLEEDRSLEYTIQFMQDFGKVNHWCVMNWLQEHSQTNP